MFYFRPNWLIQQICNALALQTFGTLAVICSFSVFLEVRKNPQSEVRTLLKSLALCFVLSGLSGRLQASPVGAASQHSVLFGSNGSNERGTLKCGEHRTCRRGPLHSELSSKWVKLFVFVSRCCLLQFLFILPHKTNCFLSPAVYLDFSLAESLSVDYSIKYIIPVSTNY